MAFNAIRQPERTEDIDAKSQSVTDVFLLQPATITARQEFEQLVLGYSRIEGDVLTRVYPIRHPERPWLRAQKVSYKVPDGLMHAALPVGNQATPGVYDLFNMRPWNTDAKTGLLASVTYGLPEWGATEAGDPNEDELWTIDIDSYVKNLTLPNDKYLWRTDAYNGVSTKIPIAQDDIQAFITVSYEAITIVKNFVAKYPHDTIRKMKGRVNKSSFNLLGRPYAPETLRFIGPRSRIAVSTLGSKGFTMAMSFEAITEYDDYVKSATNGTPPAESSGAGWVGWNRLYNPKASPAVWDYVVTSSSLAAGSGSALENYRYMYKFDESIQQNINGQTKKGFELLLDPRAA